MMLRMTLQEVMLAPLVLDVGVAVFDFSERS